MFYNRDRDLRVVIHGDDFTCLGQDQELDWFRKMIEERYEVKFRGRLGPEEGDAKAIRILNRVVRWDEEGIVYEADQRHAELIMHDLGIEPDSKTVVTPGIRTTAEEIKDWDTPVAPEDVTKYRAITARAMYLAQDRGDIQYAAKEASRGMSDPTMGDWRNLKRLGRYLIGKERHAIVYRYQGPIHAVTIWSDSDHAGCVRTRKSTTGGVCMLGTHTIKTWSTTQSVIALSSGEAEYYGMVKGASVGLGTRELIKDLGVNLRTKVNTDASAAIGIASRKGLGKVRHIEVNQLWLQDKVGTKEIEILKVGSKSNLEV